MPTGGIEDVLVANQIAQPHKVAAVAALAREHPDHGHSGRRPQCRALSRAATEAGSQLEVLPELDVGSGRCGVRTKEELLPIAERIVVRAPKSAGGIQIAGSLNLDTPGEPTSPPLYPPVQPVAAEGMSMR